MIWALLLLALILRFISLDQSFWLDEAAQAVLSRQPIHAINFAKDFQPPFFYAIAHYWMALGSIFGNHHEWFLRIPSVIFSIGSIYVTYLLIKKLTNIHTASLTALLLATAPFHIYYAQEFRMYSLLTLLTALSWLFLSKKQWAAFSIITTLAFFTHYFALLNLISQAAFIIFLKRNTIKKLTLSLILPALGITIWLPTLLQQIKVSQQLVQTWPTWSTVSNPGFIKFPFLVFAKFTVGMISPTHRLLYGLSVITTIAIFLYALIRQWLIRKPLLLAFIYFSIPLFIAWIAGLWISASSPWRIQFILPAFYTLIAHGLFSSSESSKTPNTKESVTWQQALPFVLFSILIIQNILYSSLYLFNPSYQRENWREAVAYSDETIGETVSEKGIAVAEFDEPFAPMQWYSQNPKGYIGASNSMQFTEQTINAQLGKYTSQNRPHKIILFTYLYQISDPDELTEKFILKKGYILDEEKDFRGVGIIKTFKQSSF